MRDPTPPVPSLFLTTMAATLVTHQSGSVLRSSSVMAAFHIHISSVLLGRWQAKNATCQGLHEYWRHCLKASSVSRYGLVV